VADELTELTEPSLYELLSSRASTGTPAGETGITATKETIDNDTEDVSDDDVLL
jgi:hypothetical protein